MNNAEITHPLFRQAVEAIDAGEADTLAQLLESNPGLVRHRLEIPGEGYFGHPYLLWFIADNPIRVERLPSNIVAITRLIVEAVRKQAGESLQQQLDYTLGLVVTGRIPRDCGVQGELIDLLVDAGAVPGNGTGALAHGNPEAALRLIQRGGPLTLATAVGLGFAEDVERLLPGGDKEERQVAFVMAAFYGRADLSMRLIRADVDLNAFPGNQTGFHAHATALHQAVCSGSLAAVKVLVEAGADRTLKDRIYECTPLDWAEYLLRDEDIGKDGKERLGRIADYLRQEGREGQEGHGGEGGEARGGKGGAGQGG
jgi:hypothetical protein